MFKKLGLLSVALSTLLSLACGGGGSANVGADFCNKEAAAFCKKIFDCPDPNFPIPAGATQAQCVADTAKTCIEKPAQGSTDANCYGATHVNTAAQTMCLDMIAATSCADFNGGTFTYTDVCSMVCTTAATTGTAGTSGAGTAGTTGTGTAGTSGTGAAGSSGTAAAAAFCRAFSSINCDQAFKCVAPADQDATFVMTLGSNITQCKGPITDAACATPGTDCPTYSAAFGDACNMKFKAQTCDDLALNGLPIECSFVCQ
jgi:hypothetical protein